MNQFGEFSTALTSVAVKYSNDKYMVNEIAPQTVVGSSSFKYLQWDKSNSLSVPETAISRTGKANEVDFSAKEISASVSDHAISHLVSNKDIQEFEDAYNGVRDSGLLLADVVESLVGTMNLRKELEAANTIQDASKYSADNVKTYSATDSWLVDTSNPMDDIEDAITDGVVPYNRMWFALDAWVRFRRHPKVIARFYSGAPVSAGITTDMVARELGLEKIVLGNTKVISSLPGKTATTKRVWSNSAGLYLFEQPSMASTARTFAFDAYLPNQGQKLAVYRKDVAPTEAGTRGGVRLAVAEDSVVVIAAPDFGYLFKSVLAA